MFPTIKMANQARDARKPEQWREVRRRTLAKRKTTEQAIESRESTITQPGQSRERGRRARDREEREGAGDSSQAHSNPERPVQSLIIPEGREVPQVPLGEDKSLKSINMEVQTLEREGVRH